MVVVEFAVETFADTAVVLLALVVRLAVLHLHEAFAVFGFRPIVAVVGIEMPLVKTKFGEQHRASRELIEAAE